MNKLKVMIALAMLLAVSNTYTLEQADETFLNQLIRHVAVNPKRQLTPDQVKRVQELMSDSDAQAKIDVIASKSGSIATQLQQKLVQQKQTVVVAKKPVAAQRGAKPAARRTVQRRPATKKAAPAKKAAPVKRTAPVKKTTPVRKTASVRKASPVKRAPARTRATKAVPVRKVAEEPVITAVPKIVVPAQLKPYIPLGEEESPQAVGEKVCNSVIIIFDPNLAEKVDGVKLGMGYKFIDVLHEKVVPLIISSNIVENFCLWKTEYQHILETIKQELLRTRNINAAQKKAQELSMNLPAPKRLSSDVLVALSGTTLSGNDWDCYVHKQADLVLLLPKNYRAGELAACGFNDIQLNKINDVSPQSLLQHIKTKKASSANLIDAVRSMFLVDKSGNSSWNIYLGGHGGPAQQKKVLKEHIFINNKSLAELERTAQSGKGKQNNAQWINAFKKSMKPELSWMASLTNLSDDAIVPQTACIAGISFDSFAQLMNLFNSINTNFVQYFTCFAGGYNQLFVNEVLEKYRVNFIAVSEGIGEAYTYGWAPTFVPQAGGTALALQTQRFTEFFGLLERFFGESPTIKNVKIPQGWQKDPLATIVRTVATTNKIESLPFVRIPEVGIFTALNVDKKVKILTNALVKAHESEGQGIDVANTGVENIVIYPSYIQVPIRITHQNIISPTPQRMEQLYQTTHIFEEIASNVNVHDIIYQFVKFNSSYSTITFVIKKLTCLHYPPYGIQNNQPLLTIENMIIQIAGHLSSSNLIDADVRVALMHAGKIYSMGWQIKDLANNSNLSSILAASPLNPTLGDIPERMMDQKNRAQLRERSVPGLAEYFEGKVEKAFGVQKVGALKKVLLIKELDGLEKSMEQETLQSQKEWLAQHRKPGVTFVSSLQHHKKELLRLKNDFGRLTAAEWSQEERNKVFGKIQNLEAAINRELAGK